MSARGAAGALALLAVLTLGAASGPTDAQVDAVARELRCVVCQNLSVADSPSELARQMRALVRERLAAGDSPEAVKAYFVERYGEWVLLTPPGRGFALIAWIVPLAALVVALGAGGAVLVRWSRRSANDSSEAEAVDPADLAAVRRAVRGRTS